MPGLREIIRGVARGANRHAEMTGKRGNKDFNPSKCDRFKIRQSGVDEFSSDENILF